MHRNIETSISVVLNQSHFKTVYETFSKRNHANQELTKGCEEFS